MGLFDGLFDYIGKGDYESFKKEVERGNANWQTRRFGNVDKTAFYFLLEVIPRLEPVHVQMVKLLISKELIYGEDVGHGPRTPINPLEHAIYSYSPEKKDAESRMEIINLILADREFLCLDWDDAISGAKLVRRSRLSEALVATFHDRSVPLITLANKLISLGADINSTDRHKRTLMHYLCKLENSEYVDEIYKLIAQGADVTARDEQGCTPLHYAKQKDVIELLIHKGADINARSNDNVTPLQNVITSGNQNAIAALISCGAVIDEDGIKQAALRWKKHNDLATLDFLLTYPIERDILLAAEVEYDEWQEVAGKISQAFDSSYGMDKFDDSALIEMVRNTWLTEFPEDQGYKNIGQAFLHYFGNSGKWSVDNEGITAYVEYAVIHENADKRKSLYNFTCTISRTGEAPSIDSESYQISINNNILEDRELNNTLFDIFLDSKE